MHQRVALGLFPPKHREHREQIAETQQRRGFAGHRAPGTNREHIGNRPGAISYSEKKTLIYSQIIRSRGLVVIACSGAGIGIGVVSTAAAARPGWQGYWPTSGRAVDLVLATVLSWCWPALAQCPLRQRAGRVHCFRYRFGCLRTVPERCAEGFPRGAIPSRRLSWRLPHRRNLLRALHWRRGPITCSVSERQHGALYLFFVP